MSDAKRGRPKGTTRATAKKIARGLEQVTSFIESEDYADLSYDNRRRVEGAQKSLTRLLADLSS